MHRLSVTAAIQTPLKFHFEKYDPQTQMALLWVHVPQISGGSKTEKSTLTTEIRRTRGADVRHLRCIADAGIVFGDGTGMPPI